MNKIECVKLLEHGYKDYADRITRGENAVNVVADLFWRVAVERHLIAHLCAALARDAAPSSDFWMVYREGGRPPAFKHSTEDSAIAEANRISRASGEKTYVLAAVKAIDPHAMPSVDEFRRHAEMHGKNGIGLWRLVPEDKDLLPSLVAVAVDNSEAWVCGRNGTRIYMCKSVGEKWFPLDATGKDIDEEIPF